uniref:Putative G-protein coupled receptor 158 n=1 Tax=Aceria tosichella TaxID=561515 RepID=A0A6G1SQP3_9ACAR
MDRLKWSNKSSLAGTLTASVGGISTGPTPSISWSMRREARRRSKWAAAAANSHLLSSSLGTREAPVAELTFSQGESVNGQPAQLPLPPTTSSPPDAVVIREHKGQRSSGGGNVGTGLNRRTREMSKTDDDDDHDVDADGGSGCSGSSVCGGYTVGEATIVAGAFLLAEPTASQVHFSRQWRTVGVAHLEKSKFCVQCDDGDDDDGAQAKLSARCERGSLQAAAKLDENGSGSLKLLLGGIHLTTTTTQCISQACMYTHQPTRGPLERSCRRHGRQTCEPSRSSGATLEAAAAGARLDIELDELDNIFFCNQHRRYHIANPPKVWPLPLLPEWHKNAAAANHVLALAGRSRLRILIVVATYRDNGGHSMVVVFATSAPVPPTRVYSKSRPLLSHEFVAAFVATNQCCQDWRTPTTTTNRTSSCQTKFALVAVTRASRALGQVQVQAQIDRHRHPNEPPPQIINSEWQPWRRQWPVKMMMMMINHRPVVCVSVASSPTSEWCQQKHKQKQRRKRPVSGEISWPPRLGAAIRSSAIISGSASLAEMLILLFVKPAFEEFFHEQVQDRSERLATIPAYSSSKTRRRRRTNKFDENLTTTRTRTKTTTTTTTTPATTAPATTIAASASPSSQPKPEELKMRARRRFAGKGRNLPWATITKQNSRAPKGGSSFLLLLLLLLLLTFTHLPGVWWQLFTSPLILASSTKLEADVLNDMNKTGDATAADLDLWRSLLGRLYAADRRDSAELAERVAWRLTKWPRRSEPALFYVEQLARRLESNERRANEDQHAKWAFCRTVSLAELMIASPLSSSSSRQDQVERDDLQTTRVWPPSLGLHLSSSGSESARLAQLAVDNANLITRLLMMDHSHHGGQQQQLQKRALDGLLSDSGSGSGSSRSSGDSVGAGPNDTGLLKEALKFRRGRRSVGGSPTSSSSSSSLQQLDQMEALLRHLVEPKLLNFMLEYKLNEFLASSSSSDATTARHNYSPLRGQHMRRMLHSIGLVLFRNGAAVSSRAARKYADGTENSHDKSTSTTSTSAGSGGTVWDTVATAAAANASRDDSIAYSRLATIASGARSKHNNNKQQIELLDLLELQQKRSQQTGPEVIPSAILKWLRLAQKQQRTGAADPQNGRSPMESGQLLEPGLLARLEAQLSLSSQPGSSGEQQQQGAGGQDLTSTDGTWFAPYFDCGATNRWLLTYSIPFFSLARSPTNPSQKIVQIRGVSYVNLDLASTGPLISQCAPDQYEDQEEGIATRHYGASEEINKTKQQQQETPSFLAGTNHCHLVGSSQCVPLLEYFESSPLSPDWNDGPGSAHDGPQFRPGAYVCQCPARFPRLRLSNNQQPAGGSEANQRQLIGLLDPKTQQQQRRLRPPGLDQRLSSSISTNDANDKSPPPALTAEQLAATLATHDEDNGGRSRFRLKDRETIAELLLAREPQARPNVEHGFSWGPTIAANSNNNNKSSSSGHDTGLSLSRDGRRAKFRSFVLGAELESAVALKMLAGSLPIDEPNSALQDEASLSSTRPHSSGSSAGLPERACRACDAGYELQPGPDQVLECLPTQSTGENEQDEGDTIDDEAQLRGAGGGTNWIRLLVFVIQMVCIVLTLALIGIILRIRKSRTIIVSGWLMLETMLLGALLLYGSVLVRYFQATSLTCLVEPWLRELGFSTFYGSILIKLYRILTEFQTRKAHRVCMRDKDQIVYLLAIVFIVIGYMSAWTALMVDGFFVRQSSPGGGDESPILGTGFQGHILSSSSAPPSTFLSPSFRMSTMPAGELNSNGVDLLSDESSSVLSFVSTTKNAAGATRDDGMGRTIVSQLELVKRATSINSSGERKKDDSDNNNDEDNNNIDNQLVFAPNERDGQDENGIPFDGLRLDAVQSRDLKSSSSSTLPDARTKRRRFKATSADYERRAGREVARNNNERTSLGVGGSHQDEQDDDDDDGTVKPQLAARKPQESMLETAPVGPLRAPPSSSSLPHLPSHLEDRFPKTAGSQRRRRAAGASAESEARTRARAGTEAWTEAGPTKKRKREIITASTGLLNDHLEILARGLNSFGELFLGLLETERKYDLKSDTFVYFIRCRKLTWDYVTESSEIALLLFGLHLFYKLRNAPMEVNKEKLILGLAVLFELITSTLAYLIRHSLWHSLTSDHLLVLYAIRCQLTVTLTVLLVFGPKLWEIGRSKPSLLVAALCGRWILDALVGAGGCDVLSSSRSGLGAGSGADDGQSSGATRAGGSRGASVRHRCHISCEVHDHHLNDATRLHQAMLSNSALEIGSINLADMDPDEIQAELKRVYTQLELLKTKVMRRDNPHISKRRGGRKPGHRKFSLQAFHGRHSTSGTEHNASQQHHSSISSQPTTSGCNDPSQMGGGGNTGGGPTAARGAGGGATDISELAGACRQQQQQQQQQQHSASSSIKRLPAVTELEGESSAAGHTSGSQDERSRAHMHTIKHVRLDERLNQEQQQQQQQHSKLAHKAFSSLRSGGNGKSIVANRSHAASNHYGESTTKWTPELPSTSSLGYDDDAMMNDSQSSGEMTPQHRSSIIYNH